MTPASGAASLAPVASPLFPAASRSGMAGRLFRPRVGLLAVAAALVGALLRPGAVDPGSLAACLAGVGLLAAGCSALNQVQERRRDGLMARTADRPLPSGRMRPDQALALALACLAGAGVLLARAGAHEGNAGMLMGLAGLVVMLYNGLYTPLKPVSPFCLLPGGAAGAMPPLFGWVAAGGDPLDVRVLVLAGALFCWQVPHFWLFAQRHRADYEAAGCPVPAALGRTAPRLPLLAWLGGYVALMLLTALLVPSLRAGPAVVPVAVWLSACLAAGLAGLACLRSNREGRGFGLVNGSMLVFLAGLAAGTLLGPAA